MKIKIVKKYWMIIIGVVVFAVLLFRFDIGRSYETLAGVHPLLLLASIACAGAGQLLAYLKWKFMQKKTGDGSEPVLEILSSVVVSGMVSPARSGDLIASLAWPKIQGKVLAWSLFNRITEGLGTLLIAALVFVFAVGSYHVGMQWTALGVIFLAAVLVIAVIFNENFGLFFLGASISFLRNRRQSKAVKKILDYELKIREQLKFFYQVMSGLKTWDGTILFSGMICFSRFFTIASNYYLVRALGMDLTAREILMLLSISWLSFFASPTPNGIGVGDVPPSLYLNSLGYEAYIGGYLILNRTLEFLILATWSAIWSFCVLRHKTSTRA